MSSNGNEKEPVFYEDRRGAGRSERREDREEDDGKNRRDDDEKRYSSSRSGRHREDDDDYYRGSSRSHHQRSDRDRDRRDRDYYGSSDRHRDSRDSRDYRHRDHHDRRDYRERDSRRRGDDDDYYRRSSRRNSRSPHRRSSNNKTPSPAALPLSQWPRKLNNWDMPPPGYEHMSAMQVKAAGMFRVHGQQGANEYAWGNLAQNNPAAQSANLVKLARRIYVGNIPLGVTETEISEFFQSLLSQLSDGQLVMEGNPVCSVTMNTERNYGFVEFRTPEEANLALGFDNIMFQGCELKLRRPKDYSATGGASIISTVPDTPNRIFIGNLPTYLTDDQVRELLEAFGELKAFHLIKDEVSGASKGYAFCEYLNPELTDIACTGLNDMELGEDKLVVQRSSEGGARMLDMIGMQAAMGGTSSANGSLLSSISFHQSDLQPTRILQLLNMITPKDLVDDEEYQDIKDDIHDECSKYGRVLQVEIPRPVTGLQVPGVGKIFVEYASEAEAKQASEALSGRKFADRIVITSFFPLEQFQNKEF